MRSACLALASLASLAAVGLAGCSSDDHTPPPNLALARYERTPFVGPIYILHVDAASLAMGSNYTTTDVQATLTSAGATQLDAAIDALEAGWDGPYGCGGDCFGGESFHFTSDDGSPWIWHFPEQADELHPETAALRAVTDALVLEMNGCRGGSLIQQCFEPL